MAVLVGSVLKQISRLTSVVLIALSLLGVTGMDVMSSVIEKVMKVLSMASLVLNVFTLTRVKMTMRNGAIRVVVPASANRPYCAVITLDVALRKLMIEFVMLGGVPPTMWNVKWMMDRVRLLMCWVSVLSCSIRVTIRIDILKMTVVLSVSSLHDLLIAWCLMRNRVSRLTVGVLKATRQAYMVLVVIVVVVCPRSMLHCVRTVHRAFIVTVLLF